MKYIIKHIVCAVCAISLLSCKGSSDRNYIAINKTDSNIGFVVGDARIRTIVEPYHKFEHYERVDGHRPSTSDYKLSNIDDTTSIYINLNQMIAISGGGGTLKTKIDTILYNAFSYYGRYTTQWVVTDELLSVMTHDESLLAEFPDFYKK